MKTIQSMKWMLQVLGDQSKVSVKVSASLRYNPTLCRLASGITKHFKSNSLHYFYILLKIGKYYQQDLDIHSPSSWTVNWQMQHKMLSGTIPMHNNSHETLAPKKEIIHKLHEISKETMIKKTSGTELDFWETDRQPDRHTKRWTDST